MKYSELKTIAKKHGWEIDNSYNYWLYANKLLTKIQIDKTGTKVLNITTDGAYCSLFEEKEFIEACYELAETPIEDREDEKYYTIELPFLNATDEKFSLRRSFTEPYWCTAFSSRFTEKEIKELDPRLWEFAVGVKE